MDTTLLVRPLQTNIACIDAEQPAPCARCSNTGTDFVLGDCAGAVVAVACECGRGSDRPKFPAEYLAVQIASAVLIMGLVGGAIFYVMP